MSNDNKRLLKYLGILFLAVLLVYKLPHDSYSLSQYIIKPIRMGNITIFLSGIISLTLVIIGIKGILGIEKFANKSRLLIFILVCVIIIPIMNWVIDSTRINYYWIKNEGLNAVDIKEANTSFMGLNDNIKINVEIELKDYGRKQNEFRIRVYLPKTLSEYLGKEYYDLEDNYWTHGGRSTLKVEEQIDINLDSVKVRNQLSDFSWYGQAVKYELFNDKDTVQIVDHGL